MDRHRRNIANKIRYTWNKQFKNRTEMLLLFFKVAGLWKFLFTKYRLKILIKYVLFQQFLFTFHALFSQYKVFTENVSGSLPRLLFVNWLPDKGIILHYRRGHPLSTSPFFVAFLDSTPCHQKIAKMYTFLI